MSRAIEIVFSSVLDELNYRHLTSAREVRIDGCEAVEWYFDWATDGLKYEKYVQSEQNRRSPDLILEANVSSISLLKGRGWSWKTLSPFVAAPISQLAAIPFDASLFDSRQYDKPAIELVNLFCRLNGVKLANATKLLYQKRTGMIPVLDQFARQAFNLPWVDGDEEDFSQVLKMAFWNLREFNEMNRDAIDELETWTNSGPAQAIGLHLTRLRIIDILGWGAIKRREVVSANPS